MATRNGVSRRDFFKTVGTAAGAAGMAGVSAEAAAATALSQDAAAVAPSPLPEPAASPFPAMNRRALGWLRLLWEKAVTQDDWGSNGVPHPWWDRYTNPVVLSYGRFDLSYSAYGLLMMADQTPAWREVYTRITDEFAKRYPTYWGAVDWLTQIGDDPKRAKYPPAIMATLPPTLRGNYNRFGWTGNGIEPYGIQKDPIGADGYLFFRGWFHLLLGTYKYISGDDKWARPFPVTGYGDEVFEWDHHRLAARLEAQYRQRPEGPHCENTKIWYYCNSAATLGMYLYDKVYNKQTHLAADNFLEYSRKNYIGVGSDGKLQWVTAYYDPLVNFKLNSPGAAGGLSAAFLIAPQNREYATFLYEAAANALGYRAPNAQVRSNPSALALAREFGDTQVADILQAAAEREADPRFFGKNNEMFGWFFGMNEGYPRGQLSANMMVSQIGRPGDWLRALQTPHLDKFTAPTVEGVNFPAMGLFQAWNDPASGTLTVGTYAASPDKRGVATSFTITNLPNASAVRVTLDGQPFTRFEVTGSSSIRIDSTIDTRQFRIVTGYRGADRRADAEPRPGQDRAATAATAGASIAHVQGDDRGTSERLTPRSLISVRGAGCACCSA
jgi:Linalool dehydratase/isomerase